MKIAHTGDIHACSKHRKWVQRALNNFAFTAIKEECDAAVLAGDIFDSAIGAHDPAFHMMIEVVASLAKHMPVIMPYGTATHDTPGALEAFKAIGENVYVVDEPTFINLDVCAVFVVPGLNKADHEISEVGAAQWMRNQLEDVGKHFCTWQTPTILVAHGTVTGCVTESKFAMVSPDHELSLGTLALSEADAVMLAHIHARQDWRVRTPSGKQQSVAYCGSLARLVHGHMDHVGFLVWDIEPGNARFEFHESPSRQLIDIDFPGPPDISELKRIAEDAGQNDAVRLRYTIDEEHAGSVDKRAIRDLFAGCDEIKIEARVNPVQRVRAEGISTATTLHDKLRHWAETTSSMASLSDIADRLAAIQSLIDEDILEGIS